ncbi:hypothetical protein [Nocardioides abyssi]|uniref:DUF4190 domain-containing protein n=1 Tax=Nocardioides abyssi TaxID=3058370 RepID=A0ABT8ESN6_9ACTN|nr:hypothetical protein [Nocardioides abyssi]MDN4161117.1 hypothetical protein [Nocardioides abyssi]
MTDLNALSAQQTSAGPSALFGAGVVASALLVLTACGVLVPLYAELQPLGGAVMKVGALLAVVGVGICLLRRTRHAGLGVVVGAASGLVVAWCALVAYVALFMR